MFRNEHNLRTTIKQQQELVKTGMGNAAMDLITQSRYSTLSRQDQRIAEDYSRRVHAQQSLRKDIAKAQTVSTRIGQILGKVRSDLTAIQSSLGTNNFTNTVGADTNLSADGSDREAWRASLKLSISNMSEYVAAQSLGNYALLHDVDAEQQAKGCDCERVYRAKLHYTTPHSDCTTVSVAMGGFSTSTDSAPFDAKSSPNTMWQWCVSNPDLKLKHFFELFVQHDYTTWVNELIAVYSEGGSVSTNPDYQTAIDEDSTLDDGFVSIDARIAATREYMKNVAGLSSSVVDPFMGVVATTAELDFDPSIVKGVPDLDTDIQDMITSQQQAFYDLIITNAPVIDNIEDESDMSYLSSAVHELLVTVRAYEEANDREQDGLKYVSDTAARNEAMYADQLREMVQVDVTTIKANLETLKTCASGLTVLVGDVAVSKQGFARQMRGGW